MPTVLTFEIGSWVWFMHPEEKWLPGKVVRPFKPGAAGELTLQDDSTYKIDAKMSKECLPCDEEALSMFDNMVKMNNLNEPVILHNLRSRFKAKKIYTYIGNILIAVNPFEMLPIYTPEVLDKYKDGGGRTQPPHIYAIADFAYQGMMADSANQSVVISGESGAGKTETMKLVLQFLAEASGRASKTEGGEKTDNLEQQILKSNPVMEAFGNAKTTRNNNSSRFGKWTEILFNTTGAIVGGSIINYLLEKSRIPFQAEQERNYHVFYDLLAGGELDPKMKKRLHLKDAEEFHYMNQSGVTTVETINDEKEWIELNAAMDILKMTKQEKDDVFQTTAAVLHLGDMLFQGEGGDDEIAEVKTKDSLKKAAELFGVKPDVLEKCLLKKRITGSTFKNYSVTDASDARDALAKALYAIMFDWLIKRINIVLGGSERKAEAAASGGKIKLLHIGILDIFGFEWFKTNSFEQMCINYCNEKLQFHFNEHIFKLEQAEYESEGISVDAIDFVDNQPTLDLIELKGTGILAMIDEECNVPRGSDEGLLGKLMKAHLKHPNFDKPKPKELDSRKVFKIIHYAAVVPYNTTGFLEKNRDTLPQDMSDALCTSTNKFIAALLAPSEEEKAAAKAGGRRKKKGKASLGFKFKASLNDLMERLNATAPHFVRCMKPNSVKKGGIFECYMMLDQLRNAGLLEVCRIRQIGYPVRKSFDDFVFRYRCLDLTAAKDHVTLLKALEAKGIAKPKQWAIGHSKVFMRNQQQNEFEEAREDALKDVVTVITTIARRFIVRCRYLKWQETLATIAKAVETRTEEALTEALVDAPELPLGGMHIKVVKEAVALKERLQEEKRVLALIKDAIKSRDLAELKSAVSQASEMSPEYEPEERKEAEALIATIEKERACVAQLKKATEARVKADIVAAMEEADKLGKFVTETEEYAAAVATKKRIEEEEAARATLRKAIDAKAYDDLVAALEKMEEMGLGDEEIVKEGVELRELMRAQAEARKQLNDAVEARKLDPLKAAVKKGEEVKLPEDDEAFKAGKALQKRMEEEVDVEKELEAAVEAEDISKLKKAIKRADEMKPPYLETVAESEGHPKASKLLAKLVEIEECKAELLAACKSKKFGALSSAIRKAAELNITEGKEIEKAHKLMEELGAQFAQLKSLEEACNNYDREQIREDLKKCEKMGLGKEETCDHAKSVLVKMDKQDELVEKLVEATDKKDKDKLKELLEAAEELNVSGRKDKKGDVDKAAETLAQIKKDEDAKEEIQTALKTLDRETLATVMEKAKEAGVSADVLEEGEKADESIAETMSFDKKIKEAMEEKDMDALIKLYDECTEKSIPAPQLESAKGTVKREKNVRETKAALEEAVETGDEASLKAALTKAAELGIEGDEVAEAKELSDKLAGDKELVSNLRAAMKGLVTKAQSKAGVEAADVAPLDEAIDEAISKGLAEDSDHIVEAKELKERMEKVLVVQDEIDGVIAEIKEGKGSAISQMKKLKKVLDKAEDLEMASGHVKRAKSKLRELERARFDDDDEDDEDDEDDVDAEELEKQREELFSKASQPKYLWTKYHRIRTPEDFASGVLFGKKKIKAQQLQWQSSVLHKSLTEMPKTLAKVAVLIHKSVLGYCGDKTMSFPPMLAADIMEKGLEEPELVDEIYVQILKQMTKNPRQVSVLGAWQLMSMCVGSFPPSRDFENYLLNYLLMHRDGMGQVANYARYSLRRLEGTLQSGPSHYVPSPEDIRAYKDRPPILATVELVDGNVITDELPVTPDINVGKVVDICCSFLDIKDPRKSSLGIFVYDIDEEEDEDVGFNPLADDEEAEADAAGEGAASSSSSLLPKKTPRPLTADSYLGDIVTVKVRADQKFKFVFKRKIFLDNGMDSTDEAWQNLMYYQVVDEIIQGNVPIDETEDGERGDMKHVVDIVARMFAVDYSADILTGAYDAEDASGDTEDSVKACIEAEGVEEYVPKDLRGKGDVDWADAVLKRLMEEDEDMQEPLVELDVVEHMEKIQASVVEHPMFGTCFFYVRKKAFPHEIDAAFPDSLIIGLNAQGLHFLDAKTRETLQSYGFASVYRWGGSSTQFTLFLFSEDDEEVSEVTVFTNQAPDMAGLLLDLIQAIMRSSDE